MYNNFYRIASQIDFSPWYFSRLRSRGYIHSLVCGKCKEEIPPYTPYRLRNREGNRFKYHPKCVAFTASRYENVEIEGITLQEKFWIEQFDREIFEKLLPLKDVAGDKTSKIDSV